MPLRRWFGQPQSAVSVRQAARRLQYQELRSGARRFAGALERGRQRTVQLPAPEAPRGRRCDVIMEVCDRCALWDRIGGETAIFVLRYRNRRPLMQRTAQVSRPSFNFHGTDWGWRNATASRRDRLGCRLKSPSSVGRISLRSIFLPGRSPLADVRASRFCISS